MRKLSLLCAAAILMSTAAVPSMAQSNCAKLDPACQRPTGNANYAEKNGFVCTPGQYFKGQDGRQHLCQ
jgi:hypothetical protein